MPQVLLGPWFIGPLQCACSYRRLSGMLADNLISWMPISLFLSSWRNSVALWNWFSCNRYNIFYAEKLTTPGYNLVKNALATQSFHRMILCLFHKFSKNLPEDQPQVVHISASLIYTPFIGFSPFCISYPPPSQFFLGFLPSKFYSGALILGEPYLRHFTQFGSRKQPFRTWF